MQTVYLQISSFAMGTARFKVRRFLTKSGVTESFHWLQVDYVVDGERQGTWCWMIFGWLNPHQSLEDVASYQHGGWTNRIW